MYAILRYFKKEYLKYRKIINKTLLLFLSQFIVLVLGYLIKSIQTSFLGPENYGLYAFFGTFIGFSSLFFKFGFFSSLKVLLTNHKNEEDLIGAGIAISVILGLVYFIFVFSSSYFIDSFFKIKFGYILRILSFFCSVYIFKFLIFEISIGTNKVGFNAFFDVASKALFLISIFLLIYIEKMNILNMLIIQLLILLFISIYIFSKLKPRFSNIKKNILIIYKKNKEYGKYVYLAQIADQSTYKLDGLMISYFANTTALGFYSLANILTLPISSFSKFLSQVLFKSFSNKSHVPLKVFIYNILWLIFSISFLILFGKFIIVRLFGNEFIDVVKYLLPLSIAAFINGVYQPANYFLSVKSKGQWKRNISFIMMIVNIIGNFLLIPKFGAVGAAWASALSMLSFAIPCFYYYFKLVNQ